MYSHSFLSWSAVFTYQWTLFTYSARNRPCIFCLTEIIVVIGQQEKGHLTNLLENLKAQFFLNAWTQKSHNMTIGLLILWFNSKENQKKKNNLFYCGEVCQYRLCECEDVETVFARLYDNVKLVLKAISFYTFCVLFFTHLFYWPQSKC